MDQGQMYIGLFDQDRQFAFTNLLMSKSDMKGMLKDAEEAFGIEKLFPLVFTTHFRNTDGHPIQGTYDLGVRAN